MPFARAAISLVGGCVLFAAAPSLHAQTFPSRPIRLDNRSGAGGVIGATTVVQVD